MVEPVHRRERPVADRPHGRRRHRRHVGAHHPGAGHANEAGAAVLLGRAGRVARARARAARSRSACTSTCTSTTSTPRTPSARLPASSTGRSTCSRAGAGAVRVTRGRLVRRAGPGRVAQAAADAGRRHRRSRPRRRGRTGRRHPAGRHQRPVVGRRAVVRATSGPRSATSITFGVLVLLPLLGRARRARRSALRRQAGEARQQGSPSRTSSSRSRSPFVGLLFILLGMAATALNSIDDLGLQGTVFEEGAAVAIVYGAVVAGLGAVAYWIPKLAGRMLPTKRPAGLAPLGARRRGARPRSRTSSPGSSTSRRRRPCTATTVQASCSTGSPRPATR